MINDFIERFSPVPIGEKLSDPPSYLSSFEKQFSCVLPRNLWDIMVYFGAAILFEGDARFKTTLIPSHNHTYHSLDILYGTTRDANGIIEVNTVYKAQFPDEVVAIGASLGGNQVCLHKQTGEVLFWDHEAAFDQDSFSHISHNFDEWLSEIEVKRDTGANGNTNNDVIAEKSFLDF